MTIEATHGAKYRVLYTLRKEWSIKNELSAENMEAILEYLCQAHRCQKEDLRVDDNERENGKE